MRCSEIKDLVIRGVETDDELRTANDLMAKVHFPDYFSGLHWLETSGASYPNFRREHTRIALCDGELAGSLRMNSETVRLGEARLKTGGFGWVTTTPRYRQKGVCRALLLDTLDYMKRQKYHVSLLFGIPNFYYRFGFATTLADYAIVIEAAEALAAPRGVHRIRDAKPSDIPTIQKLHAANDADVACSLVRTSAHITNKWEYYKGLKVLSTDQGKVVAYFRTRLEGEALVVDDLGVADSSLCETVLGACSRLASDEAAGQLRFLAPPSHPVARFLLQFKTTHEKRLVRDSGGMMAFVDLGETLESLIPEWEGLLARSSLVNARTEATLIVEQESYRIRANRGVVDVAAASGKNKVGLSPVDLMHMVTGFRHVEDILAVQRRLLTADGRALLCALFPKRDPYVWILDRF